MDCSQSPEDHSTLIHRKPQLGAQSEPHPPPGGGAKRGYPSSKPAPGFHQTAPTPSAARVLGRDRSQKAALSEPFPALAKGSLVSQDSSRHHSQRRQVLADNLLMFLCKKGAPQNPLSLRSTLSAAATLGATSPRHTPPGGHHHRGDAQKDVPQQPAGSRAAPVLRFPRLSALSRSLIHLPNCGQVEGMMEDVAALRGPEQPGGQRG